MVSGMMSTPSDSPPSPRASGCSQRLSRPSTEVDDAMGPPRDENLAQAVPVSRRTWNGQEGLPLAERLVVHGQDALVISQVLQEAHDPGPQPVLHASGIQDAGPLGPIQNLHRRDVNATGPELGQDVIHCFTVRKQRRDLLGRSVPE